MFLKFATIHNIDYYYISAARAIDYKETEKTYSYFKSHIESASHNKWISIIDCAGMKQRHYSSIGLIHKVVKLLTTEHKDKLEKIWILHPNSWVRATLAIVKPFLSKETQAKIRIFDSNKLILYTDLEKAGLTGKGLLWLISVFGLEPVPGQLPLL